MDNINRRSYSESLRNTLSCYQLSSADSLSGPSGYPALAAQLWFKENNQSPPTPRPPVIQIPLLIPNDTSTNRSETYLSGEKISCFIVGGEKRLCLPQILTTVLKDFSIQEINRTCAELHIYCSRCSPDQLEILKVLGILPFNTTQCGLITKTDAERLVSALGAEYHLNGKHDFNTEKCKGILVYHECFGRGDGLFYPDLYLSPDSTCIACLDCRSTFSPTRFVLHSHSILEKRTCHWGFDRENWRNYLLIPRNMEEAKYLELEKQLNQLKARFDPSADAYIHNYQLKRRLKTESDGKEVNSKRLKEEKDLEVVNPTPSVAPSCFGVPFPIRTSAFKPWGSSNLSGLAEMQAAQDVALMKAFVPFMQDRRLLPNLLQFAPPSAATPSVAPPFVSPQPASERTKPSNKTLEPPNVSLLPLDLQKKSCATSRAGLESSAQHSTGSAHRDGRSSSKQIRENSPFVKTEATGAVPRYPVACRRASDDPTRNNRSNGDDRLPQSERAHSDPALAKTQPKKSNVWKSGSYDTVHSQRTNDVNFTEKASRRKVDAVSQEEGRNSLHAMKSEVAAASAMLELSSSVEDRSKYPPSSKPDARNNKQHQSSGLESNRNGSSNSVFPKVTQFPASKEHFKWTFSDTYFIISASGTEELKEKLLSFSSHPDTDKILREVVRMKYEQEEKMDIQNRVRRDMEKELDRVKTSKQQCIDKASEERKLFRHQLERLRSDQHRTTKEANDALIQLGKNLADLRLHPGRSEDRDSLQHKILDRLHKQVDDKEDEVRDLEKQLVEERDRRVLAERRLQEEVEGGRGRISLLMDGNLSSMMKNASPPRENRPLTLPRSHVPLPPSSMSTLNGNRHKMAAGGSPLQWSRNSGVHDV